MHCTRTSSTPLIDADTQHTTSCLAFHYAKHARQLLACHHMTADRMRYQDPVNLFRPIKPPAYTQSITIRTPRSPISTILVRVPHLRHARRLSPFRVTHTMCLQPPLASDVAHQTRPADGVASVMEKGAAFCKPYALICHRLQEHLCWQLQLWRHQRKALRLHQAVIIVQPINTRH